MRHSHPHPVGRRSLRFTGPFNGILQELTGIGPLYVHARNWLAELAAIIPLTGMAVDESGNTAIFPEDGLVISLGEVEEVHGVTINYQKRQALALEFATPGEPRGVSIVAIPNISDMESFTRCLHRHPAEIVREDEYERWREKFMVRPAICPCCMAAMEERRENPERNPLTAIFQHAIAEGLELRCEIISPSMGLSTWLAPRGLQFSNGLTGLIGSDNKAMLEVDYGMCHSLRIARQVMDGEVFSEICLYDSIGQLHLKIAARGAKHEGFWREICGEA